MVRPQKFSDPSAPVLHQRHDPNAAGDDLPTELHRAARLVHLADIWPGGKAGFGEARPTRAAASHFVSDHHLRIEAIASAFGKQQSRVSRVGLDLLPQSVDVRLQGMSCHT